MGQAVHQSRHWQFNVFSEQDFFNDMHNDKTNVYLFLIARSWILSAILKKDKDIY